MANRYWVGGTETWNATAGTKWASSSGGAGGETVPTASDDVFFDAASGAVVVTLGINVDCLTLTMTGYTGTLAFGTNKITIAGNNATVFTGVTTATITGTPVIDLSYSGATGTRTVTTGAVTEANSISFNVIAGTDTVTISTVVKNLDFNQGTGFTGTLSNATRTVYGNLIFKAGMTLSAGTSVTTMGATSGTKTITSSGLTVDFPITISCSGAITALADALTVGSTRTFNASAGTFSLNGFDLTTGLFASANSNVRTIAFGSNKIIITGNNGTVYSTTTITNLTITGTPVVEATYNGATGTRRFLQGSISGGVNASHVVSIYVKAGTDIIDFNNTTARGCGDIILTGFAGTWTLNAALTTFGSLVLASGMTFGASSSILTFGATSGSKTITTAGKTLDLPVTFNSGTGGSTLWTFTDACALGATRTFTLTAGRIKFKEGTTNSAATFAFNGTYAAPASLSSAVSGTQFTISDPSGTVTATYLTVSDCIATGGATFNALWSSGNTDGGNNTGWNFGTAPDATIVQSTGINIRSFTDRRRF